MAVITQVTREYISVNEDGYRIGESHHHARIPEYIVQAIRDLRESHNLGYGTLCTIFQSHNIRRETVGKICRYEIRCQTPDRWKTIYKTRKTCIPSRS